jgi:hypothetical protein
MSKKDIAQDEKKRLFILSQLPALLLGVVAFLVFGWVLERALLWMAFGEFGGLSGVALHLWWRARLENKDDESTAYEAGWLAQIVGVTAGLMLASIVVAILLVSITVAMGGGPGGEIRPPQFVVALLAALVLGPSIAVGLTFAPRAMK